MKINREALYILYMEKVGKISNDIDWKTQFGPEEIIDIIADIIEKDPILLSEKE